MEAAGQGASDAGGLTIGILPGDSRAAANPYVSIPVVTGIGYARNVAVVKTAEAALAAAPQDLADGVPDADAAVAEAIRAKLKLVRSARLALVSPSDAGQNHAASPPQQSH